MTVATSSSSTLSVVAGVDALELGHLQRQRLDLVVAQVLEDLSGALGAERDEQHGGLLAALARRRGGPGDAALGGVRAPLA